MKKKLNRKIFETWKVVPIMLGLVVGVVAVGAAAVSTSATNTIVSVSIEQAATISFDVITPVDNQNGGNTYEVIVSGENVGNIEVYIDGVYYGTFPVNEAGTFTDKKIGTIILPEGSQPNKSYDLEFIASPKTGNLPPVTVNRTVNFTAEAPIIDHVNPSTVVGQTGGEITIHGENFTGATLVTVDGIECTNMVVVDDNTITCFAPKHALGFVDVAVTTPYGTYTKVKAFEYVAPGVPSTGLFRIGDTIVKTFDVFFVALAVGVIAVAIIYMRRLRMTPVKKTTHRSTRKAIRR